MKYAQTNNRVEYIDYFRAIGVALMVLGHINIGGGFSHFIHSFNMPMFFLVSGYFFKADYNFCYFLKKKAKSMLIPYLFFGISCWLIAKVISGVSTELLFNLFWKNTYPLAICGALWFLTALFWAEIFYYFILKYIYNKTIASSIIIILVMTGVLLGYYGITLPFSIAPAMVGVGLIHIGKTIRMNKESQLWVFLSDLKIYYIILLSIILLVLVFINGWVDMRTGKYCILPLTIINALGFSLVMLNVSRLLFLALGKNKGMKMFSDVGKNSIVYLCMNQLVIAVSEKVISYTKINGILEKISIIVFVFFVLKICECLFIQTPLKIIFGKFEITQHI